MADFTRMYSKTLGVTLAEVAEERDYGKLNDWYVRLQAELNALLRFDDDENAQRKLKNARSFMKVIKKQRTAVYREKMLSMGVAPESSHDVFERSTSKCFMTVAKKMLSEELYAEIEQRAKEMAHKLREESRKQKDDFMLKAE